MDQQPKIPTLRDAQKPQVKIKGLGTGLTLFDRLKQFKKKDLAFILAGLGTLFMAPLAEHFLMAPEGGDANLSQGWGKGGGGSNGLFGSGSSPYENGNNSIASGGTIGGSGDIITPLNVRDPSALVMGPGAAQQPPAGSAAPATPSPTASADSKTDLRDALANAASRAAGAAVKRAPLPMPKVALGGSGLRGLGAAGGGTSASSSLGPINSGNLGQAGTGGGGLNLVRSAPNFRGAAGPRGNGPTGLDGTKKAGANAGDAFSRHGSALGGLNAAAGEQIPTGGQGFGGGGQGGAGANDKPGGGGGAAGSKSVGESLAFIEAKERMMENLKLEFEKRKLKDPELLLYGIRNDSLKAMASEMTKSLTRGILGFMDPSAPGANASYTCGSYSNISPNTPACGKEPAGYCLVDLPGGKGLQIGTGPAIPCILKNGKADDPKPKGGEQAPATPGGQLAYGGELKKSGPTVGAGLDGGCAGVSALGTATPAAKGVTASVVDTGEIPYYKDDMLPRAKQLVGARALLNGGGSTTACGSTPTVAGSKTSVALQAEALKYLNEQLPVMNGLVSKAKDGEADKKSGQESVANAAKLVGIARQQVDAARKMLESAGTFVPYPKNADTEEAKDATRRLTDAKDQLVKDHKTINEAQGELEKALTKAQATIGDDKGAGTLGGVLAHNQAFIEMKSTYEQKKTGFAETAKDPENRKAWQAAAAIPELKVVTAGGSSEPAAVTTDSGTAEKAIGAFCEKIGGCTKADAAAAKPDAAADAPKYSEVSALVEPATSGVTKMRQTQTSAISGLEGDLTKLGAKK